MERHTLIIPILSVLFFTTGCGERHFLKGEPIDPQKNQLLELETDKANNGKRVSVTGYATFNNDIKIGTDDDPMLNIYTEPNGKGKLLARFPIPFGKSANKVHVSEEFGNINVLLYDNQGASHPYHQKMQYSFKLDMQVDKPRIKKYYLDDKGIPDVDSVAMIYPTRLTDIRIDPL